MPVNNCIVIELDIVLGVLSLILLLSLSYYNVIFDHHFLRVVGDAGARRHVCLFILVK